MLAKTVKVTEVELLLLRAQVERQGELLRLCREALESWARYDKHTVECEDCRLIGCPDLGGTLLDMADVLIGDALFALETR